MASVRCHLAIVAGRKLRNVIVTYPGGAFPSAAEGLLVGQCICSVKEFTVECHSTVDFNGVAVIENGSLSFLPLSVYLKTVSNV